MIVSVGERNRLSTERYLRAAACVSLLVLTVGCSSGRRTQTAESNKRFEADGKAHVEEIRNALVPPSELPHIVWRQKLTITAKGRSYHLEAVIQSDGKQFQVLALGPGGMKLFLVTQDQQGAHTEVFVQRTLSLSPEYLLFDIQRALFWKPAQLCSNQDDSWNFRDFRVADSCDQGRVTQRRVSDGPATSPHFEEELVISYSPAFDFGGPPEALSLKHLSRGYQIDIVQLESHQLP